MEHPPQRTYYVVFAALVALLAVTVVAAEFDLGRAGFLVAVMIASVKAVLILLYFMHVRYSSHIIWVAVAAGAFWVGILLVLTMSDYLTRGWLPVTGW